MSFHPVEDDIDLGELLVGPYDNTVVLEELRCVFMLLSNRPLMLFVIKHLTILLFCSTELVPNTR